MSSTLSVQAELAEIEKRNLYRRRRIVQEWVAGSNGTLAVVDGERRVVFCSNDYLGLAQHPLVLEAFQKAARQHGVGSGASHLVTGHSREHHALEETLAEFTGRERALLFSTGYMANLGVVSALVSRGDLIVQDRFNHASLLDGGLLSGARFTRYAHANPAAAEARLSNGHRRTLIASDGVFSMDGDVAPLTALADLAQRRRAWLMVDDAHGIGVIGSRGRGTTELCGLDQQRVPVLMGTFGKALGTFGAFVAGERNLIELLLQKARSYIYTTALPPAAAAAARASVALVDQEAWRRDQLRANVARFRAAMKQLQAPLLPSSSPIQPMLLGSAQRALQVSEALWNRGIWVAAIRPPTVPEGSSRLRITFSAAHTVEQVDQLIEALASALPEMP